MNHLVEYLFVDFERVIRYLEQFREEEVKEPKRSVSISMSLTGPRLDAKQEQQVRERNLHEQVTSLIKLLRRHNLVQTDRPQRMRMDVNSPFCIETMIAQKVILPAEELKQIPGLREFAVWVAKPKEQYDYGKPRYEAQGTFLFLTEAFWDTSEFQSVYSGCSALKAIVNVAKGKELIERGNDWDWIIENPVDKLREFGGVPSNEREITSLYRMRYMTDEVFIGGGRDVGLRRHDLLGYPIFIAESLNQTNSQQQEAWL